MVDDRFSQPLYTVSQAARIIGTPPSTLRSWANGYTRQFEDRRVDKEPVITAVEASPREPRIPFIGLVEAMVIQAFRQTHLPLQRIRRALNVLADQGQLEHALASRRLYSDGAEILYNYVVESGDDELRLLVVWSGQRVFHEVIQDYLQRIDFDKGDDWATAITVPVTREPILKIRPRVASGQPIFVHGGAPLWTVLSRHQAGESVESIAYDCDLPVDDLYDAFSAFESETPAAA